MSVGVAGKGVGVRVVQKQKGVVAMRAGGQVAETETRGKEIGSEAGAAATTVVVHYHRSASHTTSMRQNVNTCNLLYLIYNDARTPDTKCK